MFRNNSSPGIVVAIPSIDNSFPGIVVAIPNIDNSLPSIVAAIPSMVVGWLVVSWFGWLFVGCLLVVSWFVCLD